MGRPHGRRRVAADLLNSQPPFLLLWHGQRRQWQVVSLSLAASGCANSLLLLGFHLWGWMSAELRAHGRLSAVTRGHSELSCTQLSVPSSCTAGQCVLEHCSRQHTPPQPGLICSSGALLGFALDGEQSSAQQFLPPDLKIWILI